MKRYSVPLAALLAAMTLDMNAASATQTLTKTETTTTVVTQKDLPRGEKIDFTAFDLNEDKMLSMQEVGEKLFYVFDRDGNEVLDNNEFYRNTVLTVSPMERETMQFIDYTGDGTTDFYTYKYDEFIRVSNLIRFDEDLDGLSAADFIGSSFLQLDDNDDKAIRLQEWEEAYFALVRPKAAEQERYN